MEMMTEDRSDCFPWHHGCLLLLNVYYEIPVAASDDICCNLALFLLDLADEKVDKFILIAEALR